MSVVIGWLIPLLPLIWSLLTKVFPKLLPAVISVAGRAGVIGAICAILVKIYQFLIGVPVWIGTLFKGVGPIGAIFVAIRFILSLFMRFPVIMGFTLLLSQYYENILEKIFLTVGAMSIKIALIFVKWGKNFIDNMKENNIAELKEILGDSIDGLPPCTIDVMGYLHFVEDVGMIVSTLVFIGIYKLVTHFFFRYR